MLITAGISNWMSDIYFFLTVMYEVLLNGFQSREMSVMSKYTGGIVWRCITVLGTLLCMHVFSL